MTKNLWILTEERPKRNVIHNILFKFSKDNKIPCFIDTIRILPLLNQNGLLSERSRFLPFFLLQKNILPKEYQY